MTESCSASAPAAVGLTGADFQLLSEARRATLTTVRPDGRPRPVPVCFTYVREAKGEPRIYVALDAKPKRVADPRRLARVRDIERDERVTVLVDRWSENWGELAWLRIDGRAELIEPSHGLAEHEAAVAGLRARYPQYETQPLESMPLLRITVTELARWSASEAST